MTSDEEKAKRRWWRPRFSVRSLVLLVTLVCAYFGTWGPTKRFASEQREAALSVDGQVLFLAGDDEAGDKVVHKLYDQKLSMVGTSNFKSPAPLIVARSEITFDFKLERVVKKKRCFYLWLVGPMIKLPFELDD
jgi:hypothetical protein